MIRIRYRQQTVWIKSTGYYRKLPSTKSYSLV